MQIFILTALLAAGLPGPYPGDEPAEPPPPPPGATYPMTVDGDDEGATAQKAQDGVARRPVYEETAKHPTRDDPR